MWSIARFRWQMLRSEDRTPDNEQRLKVYYRNLINTMVLTSEGVLVLKTGGNPSGSVNTISDNTLILYMLLAYAWIMLAPLSFLSYADFDEHLALALCGDDNTWTVSDEALVFFNARSVIEVWKGIGVTTTTDCLDPRPLDELDFLSAHTVYIDGQAVPIYDRSKLLTSLLYSRAPGDPSMTLCRAAAILRVGWADQQMRDYLNELINFILVEYGRVLADEPEWQRALTQIPTEDECKILLLGKQEGFPLRNQSYRARERCNSCIKTRFKKMEVIALPQRQRRRRQFKRPARGGARRVKIGPLMPAGSFSAGGQGRIRRRKRNGKRKGRRNRNPGSQRKQTNFTGTARARGMPMGMRQGGRRRHNFDEDEFIADMFGNTTFGPGNVSGAAGGPAFQFPINPGQVVTFPWLSSIADRYEKYVLTDLEFYYEHEVSEFATAGTTGKVMLAVDYDAADPPPVSKVQMMDMDPHNDCMPCKDIVLRVDCRTAFENGPKYVRPGNLPGGSDIKTYDLGNLNFAAAGTADNTTKIGELHVRYRGWFEKPVLESTTSAPNNNQVAEFRSTAPESMTTGVAFFPALATSDANGLSAVNTAGSIVLPPGNYVVSANFTETYSVDVQTVVVALQKNTVDIAGSPLSQTYGGAADLVAAQVIQPTFFSSNGTDALRLRITATFSAGTGVVSATVNILAV